MNFKAIIKRALPFLLTLLVGVFLGSLFVFSKESDSDFLPLPVPIAQSKAEEQSHECPYWHPHPVLRLLPNATYPLKAYDNRFEGNVILNIELKADGSIGDIKIIEGQPFGMTESAIDAARKIRFTPAITNKGKDCTTSINIIYCFDLITVQ